jgi:hypothetical protein
MLERSKIKVETVIGRWYNMAMKKRSRKSGLDLNRLAKSIVDQATTDEQLLVKALEEGKNPAAVSLGRLGGLKGGKARAACLSAEQRSEIAKKAAEARWQRKLDGKDTTDTDV